jgi:hypothetical protein
MTTISRRSLIGVIVAAAALIAFLIPLSGATAQNIVVSQNANQSANIAVEGPNKMNAPEIRLTQIVKQRSDDLAAAVNNNNRHSIGLNEKKYALHATGFATDSSSDYGYSALSSEISLKLTAIAITNNLSVLKVDGGTIKVGSSSYKIHGAIATLNNVNHKLNIIAVIAGNNGQNNNGKNPFNGDSIMGIVKIHATTPVNGKLPVTKSDPPLKIAIDKPSEIVPAHLYLKMTGEVKLA